jgi:hypothetical protein
LNSAPEWSAGRFSLEMSFSFLSKIFNPFLLFLFEIPAVISVCKSSLWTGLHKSSFEKKNRKFRNMKLSF